jgi:protocatechuate 3,4-dioxygenase beta subunit
MDTTRRQILQALGVTIAGSPLAPLAPGMIRVAEAQATCVQTASDTVGPYPNHTAFYRQDIREGRPGLPLDLVLTVISTTAGCVPIAGASVEIWQCDASGHYSEYAQPGYDGTGQTYLRGLQVADANGKVTFNTIYPGWYQGRATHIHLKVHVDGVEVKTTQLAFPEAISQLVYANVSPYSSHGQNSLTNATDNVFSDGTSTQMVTLTGDTTNGYTGTLTLAVAAAVTNTAPTISAIADQTIDANTSTAALAFTIADAQTDASSLIVSGSSSNSTLVPTANIVFGGSGATRTVTVTPVANQSGTTTIAVTVSEGSATASESFVLTVGAVPAPGVTITSPDTASSESTSPFITMVGTAVSPSGDVVSAVTWTSSRGPSGSATGTTHWQAEVPLVAGTNAITVAAANSSGSVGSATVTITVTNYTYYLAEGSTGAFFDLDLLIANPNSVDAPVSIQYLKDNGTTVNQTLTIAAQRHVTIRVDEIAGLEATAVSSVVTSVNALPLAVERTMRWDATGYGAHTEKAVAGARLRWLFAEGSQGWFDTYLLLANPQTVANEADVVFLLEDGTPVTKTYTLAPTSRTTVYAGMISELVDRSFGMTVTFTLPGVAERAMYFGSTAARLWTGGHESAGVNDPSTHWFLAEGAIGAFFDTFILLSNANAYDVTATLTFLLESGTTIVHTIIVAANGRMTVNIEDVPGMPAGAAVATTVDATGPIVAERSMYWPEHDWYEAHNGFGLTTLGTKWAFGEGRVGGAPAYQTYILLANPGSTAANVAITYLREGAAPIVTNHVVQATSRLTIAPAEYGLVDENFGALLVSSASIAAERALYWTSGGVFWAAGTNASATRLP